MYTSTEDLYDKLNDAEIRGLYGIGESVTISAVNRPDYALQKQHAEKPVAVSAA